METIHFIGIGGIGMSGLAKILLEKKALKVSGSDLRSSPLTKELENLGAKVYEGHDASQIPSNCAVIISTDIALENPELQAAKRENCKILHRSDLLLDLMQEREIVAVSGTHGKTSTTGLLSHLFLEAGKDPSFAVGGILLNTQTNGHHGSGPLFIIEADESDGTFLKYPYQAAIVTNIDTDHMAHYGSIEKLEESVSQFISKAPDENLLFYCGDDIRLKRTASKGISYGFSPENSLHIKEWEATEKGSTFSLCFKGTCYKEIFLPMFGRHNVLNSAAAFGLALSLGLSEDAIRKGFSSFKGVKRRLEKKESGKQALVLDDYAHHPTAVSHTLEACSQAIEERRLIAVYQPHRPSRMKSCVDELSGAFSKADVIFVTDIYKASEGSKEISSETIWSKIQSSHPNIPFHTSSRESLVDDLMAFLRPHDVVLFLGAGDITAAASETAKRLQNNPLPKWRVGVIYGGRNAENKTSRTSAQSFWNELDPDFYEKRGFFIDYEGKWHLTDLKERFESSCIWEELEKCEVCVPVLHGPYAEDGTIQGLLETFDKPFVGCSTKASAVSMDKVMTKQIARTIDIPIAPYFYLYKSDWEKNHEQFLEKIKEKLSFPIFVKPAHMGMSIGIERVTKPEDLQEVLSNVFPLDKKLIIEQEIKGREIQVAVLGNHTLHTPPPGEILTEKTFLNYVAKVGKDRKKSTPYTDLSKEQIETVSSYSKQLYKLLDCTGLTRMDWFLDDNGAWWFNEAQPFPGFTSMSLYPSIWKAHGLPFTALIDKLIILAFASYREKRGQMYNECSLGQQLEPIHTLLKE